MPEVNRFESIAKYGAIIGALVAAAIGIGQYQRAVAQGVRELEWKQAEMARTIVALMLKNDGWDAMAMLDCYDRFFFLVSQLRAAVRSGLVRQDDVEFPLSWYVESYIAANSAPESAQYFESLEAWRRCPSG